MNVQTRLVIGLYTTAALLAAAHFLRMGSIVLLVSCLIVPLLLLYRKRWVLVLLQVMAYVMAANWMATAVQIVQVRQLEGRPWATAAFILGAVAALTVVAGLTLNSQSVKKRYPR